MTAWRKGDFAHQPVLGLFLFAAPGGGRGTPVPCGTGTSSRVDGALGIAEAGRWLCSSCWDGVSTRELSLAGLSTRGR